MGEPPAADRRWADGKARHLALSAAAAERYDELYEQANFATGSYMKYEIKKLRDAATLAPDHEIAVDLGCGTGRDTFELARTFRQVYGYDFSPDMIRVANKNKVTKTVGNVTFDVSDVERGLGDLDSESASLVNSAFGMGSFVERIEDLAQTARRLLKPSGVAVFSFYNREALVNALELSWRPALAARPVPGERLLRVDFGGVTYDIAAVMYSVEEVKRKLSSHFDVAEISTYPTLTALFPQSLFDSPTAQSLCVHVDDSLADNPALRIGPYIVAVVRKRGRISRPLPQLGYRRVLHLLDLHHIDASRLVQHQPVRNMGDVQAAFPDVDPGCMIKAILISYAKDSNTQRTKLYLMAIPADRRLDFGKVATLLGARRSEISMATAIQVDERTGFSVGSVPPFALPDNVVVFLDRSLTGLAEIWCGTGKSTESLRLSLSEFRKLSTFTVADLIKE